MKKFLVYVLVLCITLGFAGCGKEEKLGVPEKQSEEELMIYDLMEAFYKDEANANCVVTDHAVVEDKAFELLGVVQYTDAESHSACYAFVRREGGSQPVRFGKEDELVPSKDSKLVYLGEGVVSFLLENTESGEVYEYTVTYSKDGDKVNIDADSKLLEE